MIKFSNEELQHQAVEIALELELGELNRSSFMGWVNLGKSLALYEAVFLLSLGDDKIQLIASLRGNFAKAHSSVSGFF